MENLVEGQKVKYLSQSPERMREYRKKWRESHPNWSKEYYKKYPWRQTLTWINTRCNNPNDPSYIQYGGRGIKNLLTLAEIEYLWFRDKAQDMAIPSIDRKDHDGNYEVDNCRFIEKPINSGRFRREKTHCKNGHPLNEKRKCLICFNIYHRAYVKQRRVIDKNYGR